jgi:PAS domain S-box-containing protein
MKSKSKTRAKSREELEKLEWDLGKAQTKIKKQEGAITALRKSEKQFRSLMEHLSVNLYRRTPGENGRFVTANQTVAKLLGYDSAEEFVKLKAADVYLDIEDLRKFSQRLFAEKQVAGVELRLKKRGGPRIWGSFTARIVRNARGEAEYVDGVMDEPVILGQVHPCSQRHAARRQYNSDLTGHPDLGAKVGHCMVCHSAMRDRDLSQTATPLRAQPVLQ